jgi:hypothetical protein
MLAVVTSKGGWQQGQGGFPIHSKISEGSHIFNRAQSVCAETIVLEINNLFRRQ